MRAKVSLTVLLLAATWVALRLGNLVAAMTPEEGNGMVVRVYDVSGILEPFSTAPLPPRETAGFFDDQPRTPRDVAARRIVYFIEETSPEDVWEDGRRGLFTPWRPGAPSIRLFGGRLVVMQTPERQERARRLLADFARIGPGVARPLAENPYGGRK